MGKLLLHVASAVLLVALRRRFGRAWWATTGAVVLGAVCVHLLSELLSGSPRHIGAASVSSDDPLMLSAFDEAKRTWPQFLRQVMVADGSLRGGFTQQATFRIIERESGSLPRQYADQLSRYRPDLE